MTVHLIIYLFIFFNIIYILSLLKKDYSIVDIFWSLGFILVTIISQAHLKRMDFRSIILCAMVLLWAIRLSYFLYCRKRGKGEDFRYHNMRKKWGEWANLKAYFLIFILQGALLLIVSSPVPLILSKSNSPLKESDILAVLIFTIGFCIESIADYQMMKFKRENQQGILTDGFWKFSRHPNYFGEFMVWWGIFFLSMADGPIFYSLIGPALLTFLLLKVSGIPLLEEKYKNNPEYLSYKKKTNAFFPWIPKD